MLSMGSDALEVTVLDTGKGPQGHAAAPDIDKKMHEQEDARGMGMFLIESLVDEVEWVSSPPVGSYARMVIRLHPADFKKGGSDAGESDSSKDGRGTV